MFTGIVEEVGVIRQIRRGAHSSVLTIGAETVLSDLKIGDSVAVNGVCLTATSLCSGFFTADVMHETLRRSSLGSLTSGSRVNLERAMAANGRFGGHIVSGHIDGTGRIAATRRDDNAVWYTVETPVPLLRYIVEKGSITIDGISLTVATVVRYQCLKDVPAAFQPTIKTLMDAGILLGDGRNPQVDGYPVGVCEMLAPLQGAKYIARASLHDVPHILKAKQMIRTAFEYQLNNRGYSLVELLCACPTNLKMSPTDACRWVGEEMTKTFPLGVFKEE